MAVANSRPCSAEADAYRLAGILAFAKLFLRTLKDEHVRVHRHADRYDEPGDARGRERNRDDLDDREHEGEVLSEGKRGDDSREAVPRDHEERDDGEADDAGREP